MTINPALRTAPFVFFHFSGLDPLSPERFSKHQDRFRLDDLGETKALVLDYCREVLAAEKLAPGDVTWVIAHQANKRILDATLSRLAIPPDRCWMNLEKYGNTSSASLPMTFDEAHRAGWFKSGDVILMMSIGGGMAWGAGVVRW